MHSKRGRLDRFLMGRLQLPHKTVQRLLASGQVGVNGAVVRSGQRPVDEFDRIECQGQLLQQRQPLYLMLHKPVGLLSATFDPQHSTVLDLIDHPQRLELQLVGRLDLNSSGLLLLTNDGRWARQLMAPEAKVAKHYQVTLGQPLTQDYVQAFAQGFYFAYEDLTTAPVRLQITGDRSAELWLTEGKYHQIKRMFGRFRNPVLSLHRLAIGPLQLDPGLAPGQWRALRACELVQLPAQAKLSV